MTTKTLWSKTRGWLKGQGSKFATVQSRASDLDDDGLISETDEAVESETQGHHVVVQTVQPAPTNQSIEKLQDGFNKLIDQLQTINSHLGEQISQNENLMGRMEKLPELLENFPNVVENQKELTEKLFEQLKATSLKDQQFVEAVEKIPNETAKQSDALANIDHQLAAAADIDVQMAEGFNKFHETLDKLDQTSISQTDSIMQMSKTFAASDRYLKYIISRQNKRFMWIFMIALGVCVVAIMLLTGVIIYLKG